MKPYYADDRITIYHGEALEIIPELGPIEGVVTDPPYSSGGQYRGDRTARTLTKYVASDSSANRLADFGGDNRDQRAMLVWCSLWLAAAFNIATPGATVCVFSDWRQLPTVTDAIQVGGWIWRGIATWHKPGIRMQRGSFSASAEYIVHGTRGPRLDHDGAPQNVLRCSPVPAARKLHIAEKPERVHAWALEPVAPKGYPILDPFMGSGTTLRVALDAGRTAIGIDHDEKHCETAAERLRQGVLL